MTKVVHIPGRKVTQEQKEAVRNAFMPIARDLDNYEIPDSKVNTVIQYALDLFAKHRDTMTEKRIVRKTAEYFKLQLKGANTDENCRYKFRLGRRVFGILIFYRSYIAEDAKEATKLLTDLAGLKTPIRTVNAFIHTKEQPKTFKFKKLRLRVIKLEN